MEMINIIPNPISIQYNYSTRTYRSFTVTCHHHTVKTTVTSTPSAVRNWIYRIRRYNRDRLRRNQLVVGLGVQWRPHTDTNRNPAATLQLCVYHHCLIFQLLHSDSVPNILRSFLSDSSITFVSVAVNDHGDMLRESRHNLSVDRLIELQHVAHVRRGVPRWISRETLAQVILELDDIVEPPWTRTSNWESIVLSDEQVEYASIDAFISFMLGRELQAWNWNG